MGQAKITAILFIITAVITAYWFFLASNRSKTVFIVLISWMALQTFLALSGIYKSTDTIPPNIFLGVSPTFAVIIVLFSTHRGRNFIDGLNLRQLTYLNSIRIPVEIVLLWLAQLSLVPFIMTFEGTNFDILSGITAPLIAYLYFTRKSIGKRTLLIWNIVCLLLLINVVLTAVLSIPTPFQQLSFEQPNIAILQFPYNLLPTTVVPIVLFGHLVSIRRLVKQR